MPLEYVDAAVAAEYYIWLAFSIKDQAPARSQSTVSS